MKYFSMFSGVGGFEYGIEKAGEVIGKRAECIGYSEVDKYAIQVYRYHYPEHKNYGDSQRYKMLGNSVTTSVIEAIAERLLSEI